MIKRYLALSLILGVGLTACSSKLASKDQPSGSLAATTTGNATTSSSATLPGVTGSSTFNPIVVTSAVRDINGSPIASGQSYFLRNVGSNLCVDLQNGTLDNGGVVQSYDCMAANPNQIWAVTVNSDATLSFISTQSALCLDLPYYSIPNENNPYQTWDCTGVNNQSFNVTSATHGGYQLVNSDSLFQCVTDGGSDGALVSAVTCAGSATQAFDLIPADNADPTNATKTLSGATTTTCTTANGAGQIPAIGLTQMASSLLATPILVTNNSDCDSYCDAYNATTCAMTTSSTGGTFTCSPLSSSGTAIAPAGGFFAVSCSSN